MSTWPYLFKQVINNNFDKELYEKFKEDLFKTTCHNTSILHFAVIIGNIEIIEYILDNGVDINSQNVFEETPLHWCCKEGNLQIAKLLINNGANYNSLDFDGNSPLHWAAEYDQYEIVSYLLSLGVQVEEVNITEETPMELAIINSCSKTISILNAHITSSTSSKTIQMLTLSSFNSMVSCNPSFS